MTGPNRRHSDKWVKALVVLMILGGAVLAHEIGVVSGQGTRLAAATAKVDAQGRQIHRLLASQTGNRVHNVSQWCGGINATRGANRRLLKQIRINFPGIQLPAYTLPDLPCTQLELGTAASTKPKKHR